MNLRASDAPPRPEVVPIPVIVPAYPVTVRISSILSTLPVGVYARTCGAIVYPNPGFVMEIGVDNAPLVIVTVAVAVDPIPTPILGGALIETLVVEPTYPLPPLTIVSP